MKRLIAFSLIAGVVLVACGPSAQPQPKAKAPQLGTPEQKPGPSATPGEVPKPQAAAPQPAAQKPLTIGVMPKLVGIPFFNAAEKGAKEAGAELGLTVDYKGPVENDVQQQVQMIETWIAKGYDAIAVAPNDPDAIAPVLQKARKRGITVVAWDADAQADARDFFCNQCTYQSVAKALMDVMAERSVPLGEPGVRQGAGQDAKYLILTGSLTAANQNIWMREMEAYRQATYPNMTNLSETPKVSEESQELATKVTTDCLKAYPDLQGVFAITSQALPGAAEAIRKAGAADRVFLTGLSTPNTMREYIKDGTLKRFVLWNPVDLGYLAVQVAVAKARGQLQPGAATFKAGRLGELKVEGDQVILGPPLVFDKDNIDQFDF